MKTENRKWKPFAVLFGVWTLLGLSFAAISYLAALSENRPASAWAIFSTNLLRFYIWAALSPLIYQIAKRFDFTKQSSALRGICAHLPLGLLFSVLHSLIFTGILWVMDGSYRQRYPTIIKFFQEYIFFGSLYLGIMLYALIVITMQAFLFLRNYRAAEERSSRLQAQLAESQLRALKMQLQPHFLFNTLHSISSLNLVDPKRANLMIARLGEFLRMTLDRSGEQTVTLDEELAFLRCYLEIEQIRFSDRLTIEFDLAEETLAAEVPHLILQPVVENAIKHGIAPHSAPGRIVIGSEKGNDSLVLKVSDNGAGIDENGNKNNGTGLSNVRSRLRQIYGDNFNFEMKNGAGNGLTVRLEIPFLQDSFTSESRQIKNGKEN
ncbi:MAG TPA: histidine kinase [Pyrinomonadaceae bacterium]|jgi:sensor histidine kinase YesM